jgi:HSP20 family molecular chaperone IbpA
MKELDNMDSEDNLNQNKVPKNFQIRFSTNMPGAKIVQSQVPKEKEFEESQHKIKLSQRNLPMVNADSRIRRLPEGVIYEIDVPGVRSKSDVIITKLENSLEIRAYSKEKCYIKTIPLKVDVLKYGVKDNKVFLQIKN